MYSKGNDHVVDATRCGVLVREKFRMADMEGATEMVMPVLTEPVFTW